MGTKLFNSQIPKISIVVPLYNKKKYIQETIASILAQTLQDWELIVVDNGSTDGSDRVVQTFSDPRIQLVYSPKRGPGAARNYGLKLAKGNWIQFLDADDLLEPDHLEQQLKTAEKNPQADIIACYWQEFIEGSPEKKVLKKPTGIGQPIEFLRDSAIAFCPWAVHAAIIRRSALSECHYWNEELDQYLGEDIAFWFPLISQSQVAYSSSIGALYRTQTPQCRTQRLNIEKWFEGVHRAILSNLYFLHTQNHACTPRQYENLVRVYSEIYIAAQQQNQDHICTQALREANKWLSYYFEVSHSTTFSMSLRRILGIKIFLRLKAIFLLLQTDRSL